ncbi:ATP synthase gamma chain [Planctomycetota bacterium]|nr:ATP synthase gamma chain [Planctomycetota bacterium]
MANLRDLRKRRKSTANTKKITRTMELVASAKLKKAQDAASASRPYAEAMRALVSDLSASAGGLSHPLMAKRPLKKVAILVAASDRGLCGAFNANLVNLAVQRGKEHQAAGRTVEFIALGKKGGSTLAFAGFPASATHTGLVGATTFPQAERLADTVIPRFLSGQVDLVEVIYSRFISAARQAPDHLVLLPSGGDSAAAKGKHAAHDFETIPEEPEDLLAGLIPATVRTALFSALLQTSAGEHAARRVAMKNASDAAGDMVKSLSIAYNRGRQGKITQEIAEIVGAVEAMA